MQEHQPKRDPADRGHPPGRCPVCETIIEGGYVRFSERDGGPPTVYAQCPGCEIVVRIEGVSLDATV